jgi:hypothetical protein
VNTFAHIKIIGKYDKVSYYSVMLDGNQTSMFEDFFTNHEVKNFNKLNHIMKWLDIIGKRYGARKDYFRNEAETADASALPPTGLKKEPSYFEKEKRKPITFDFIVYKPMNMLFSFLTVILKPQNIHKIVQM